METMETPLDPPLNPVCYTERIQKFPNARIPGVSDSAINSVFQAALSRGRVTGYICTCTGYICTCTDRTQ